MTKKISRTSGIRNKILGFKVFAGALVSVKWHVKGIRKKRMKILVKETLVI